MRGNVNTRLAKLDAGEFDAIMLACAGLDRLGLADRIRQQFDPDQLLPAAAQGVIGIECLAGRDDLATLLEAIEHPHTRCTTLAERAVAHRLEASCQSPVASYATLDGETLEVTSLVAAADGSRLLKERVIGSAGDAEALGVGLADRLLGLGAAELLGTEEP